MHRLHARPGKCRMKVRIPVVPELDDVEERLQNGLLLIVAPRSADCHERLAVFQDKTGRQGVARARAGFHVVRALLLEEELLATAAHLDSRVAKDDASAYPSAARRRVEHVAVL